jgi:hypothetical protein
MDFIKTEGSKIKALVNDNLDRQGRTNKLLTKMNKNMEEMEKSAEEINLELYHRIYDKKNHENKK